MIFERDDVVDILARDDETVVLTSRQCLWLTEVPAAIVELLVEPKTEDDVRLRLEERFGPAPEGRLAEVLEELQSQGVVRVAPESALSDES